MDEKTLRASIRYSFPENAKAERRRIRAALDGAGFDKIAEAHYETADTALPDLLVAIRTVLDAAESAGAVNVLSIEVVDSGSSKGRTWGKTSQMSR